MTTTLRFRSRNPTDLTYMIKESSLFLSFTLLYIQVFTAQLREHRASNVIIFPILSLSYARFNLYKDFVFDVFYRYNQSFVPLVVVVVVVSRRKLVSKELIRSFRWSHFSPTNSIDAFLVSAILIEMFKSI